MGNKILTAEEFIINEFCGGYIPPKYKESIVTDLMIDFAKLHVKEALRLASENAWHRDDDGFVRRSSETKNEILNAYPLDNIK